MTTSKRDRHRIERTVARRDLFGSGIISLTSETNFHIDAIFDGAATVMCASGRPALIARTAGTLITASPSQLLERMRIRNGLRSLRETPAGRWMPRLYWARRKFGWGVFQRLCTQNQSSGATRIWCSIISLIFDVRSATEAPGRSKRPLNTIRQRAGPVV